MESLSLCMIVKNEENVIARCLESVKGLVNEIIVVDTGSIDETKRIVKSFGVKVYDFKWNNNFSDARNFALEHSTSSWNLVLDADEYIINVNEEDICRFINSESAIGKIEIVNKFFDGNEVKHTRAFVSRLIPKGIKYKGRIHEQLVSDLPRKSIHLVVEHDGYYLTKKSERNIPLLIEEVKSNPEDPYYLYQLAKEYRLSKDYQLATEYYGRAYTLLKGNETYHPNVVIDYLYTLKDITKFESAFNIIQENQTHLNQLSDFHFIKALLLMDLIFSNVNKYSHLLPEIEQCYLKCIELGDSRGYESVIGTGSFTALYNLGVYYETTGRIERAKDCYRGATEYNYKPAIDRLQLL